MPNGLKTTGGPHGHKPPPPSHGWGGGKKNAAPSRLDEAWLKANIKLENLDPELFSKVAAEAAKSVSEVEKDKFNKRTQLRRFYDELTMWNDRVEQMPREAQPDKYRELAPFIKMLKAKVVYAQSREHVDETFTALFSRCLDEIKDPKTLRYAKLFLEAFMGFYRQYD